MLPSTVHRESSASLLSSSDASSTTAPLTTGTPSDLTTTHPASLPLSPRTLYAQSFDRPTTARSLPSTGRYRKDMSNFTGAHTTEEEFDRLPVAVQRKYFSTLERLRFAETSRSNTFNELPVQRHRRTSLAERRGLSINPIVDHGESPRRHIRRLSRQHTRSVTTADASWFLTLPEKIRKREFTREEQVILAGGLRESVILDAADEAIYKARQNRLLSPVLDSPACPLSVRSPTSSISTDMTREMPETYRPSTETSLDQSIYENFRWMDTEQDLDLKLDDYHANLDGAVLPNASSRRPSFRRTMSITKIPFGRNSLSSLGPRSPKFDTPHHGRQTSKAMSMMVPRHLVHESVSSIDPNATHYQDPEARLKLRVYLASPQKFDEAIEFGFPSLDGVAEDKENKPPRRMSRDVGGKQHSTDTGRSFLFSDIETTSLFADDVSMMEPDSPLTPEDKEPGFRSHIRGGAPYVAKSGKSSTDFSHLGIHKPTLVKQPETYTQALAGSREMTLRMTLTRPDLRADEKAIYGWQAPNSKVLEREPLAVQETVDNTEMLRGPFGGTDGWATEKENGVVKRFWNKVRTSSSQKKNSMVALKSG